MISNETRLARRTAIRTLLENRGDLLLVTGLGSTTWDAASVADDERNFYLWGAMGAAAMVGLGLAIAQPARRVLVVTGDGEMLMGLGSLATIGVQRPPNLSIAVFDNGHYGETGMQASHTAETVDLTNVAQACGRKHSTSPRRLASANSPPNSTIRRPACSHVSRSTPTSRRASCRRATVFS
jgi:thiamine pyrophosphate-dependent acetolactate synthase large subunit-like protein